MGWASGSEIVRRVGRVVTFYVHEPRHKKAIFDELVDAATDLDIDTLDECRGIDPQLDAAINEKWGTEEDV